MTVNVDRLVKKKKSAMMFRLFVVLINVLLLYLLYESLFLSWILRFFIIVFAIVFIIEASSGKNTLLKFIYNPATSKNDILKLIIKNFKINKKYILLTTTGLIIAIIVISQGLLSSNSIRESVYQSTIGDEDRALFLQVGDSYNNPPYSYLQNIESSIKDEFMFSAQRIGLDYKEFSSDYVFNFNYIKDEITEIDDSILLEVYPISSYTYTERENDFLNKLPGTNYLNFDPEDIILVIPHTMLSENNDFSYGIVNGFIDLVVGNVKFDNAVTYDPIITRLQFTQLIVLTDEDYNFIYNQNNWGFIEFPRIYQASNKGLSIFNEHNLIQSNPGMFSVISTMYGIFNLHIDVPSLSELDADLLIEKLYELQFSVEQELWYKYGQYPLNTYSPLQYRLSQYKLDSLATNLLLSLILAPLLVLSLYLVYFSMTLIEKRKHKLISIMKIRGISKDQLNIVLYSEVLINTVISTIIGMFLSIPWLKLSLKLSNYSQLNNSSTELIIPGYWYWKLPIITLILSLDMNFYSINSLIKIHIDEGEIVEERRPPFWQRYYLDLIFFFLGTGFWVFIHLYEFEIPYMKELLMIALGVPLLVVFIFFTPLVISRYFGDVIGLISEKLWLVYAGFISLAMRNMKKNKYSSSLLASLLILGLMLSFTSMIIPETFNGNNLENIQYDLGADIYISGLDSSNSELWDKIKVDGVESYSQIHKISIQFDDKKFIILGVDPSTFADAAFWKASYAKNSLSEILASINEVSSVAIQSDILEIEGYEIGEQMSLNGSLPSLVDISNEFKYFPNLVNHLPVNNFESILERYLLTNLPTSHALFEYFSSISTHTVGVYAKLSNNANSTKVVASLRAEFSDYSHISITSVDEKLENSVSNLITEVLLNAVQGLLIITIIISFLAMSYYSYITLSERRKEIGVYRAVGMVQKQVFYMFILEGMVMLFVSFIFGSLIGIFISFNFLSIFVINNTGSVPPFSIVFPWKDVFIYSSVLILISIFSAGVPAYKISNKQTGSILRAE